MRIRTSPPGHVTHKLDAVGSSAPWRYVRRRKQTGAPGSTPATTVVGKATKQGLVDSDGVAAHCAAAAASGLAPCAAAAAAAVAVACRGADVYFLGPYRPSASKKAFFESYYVPQRLRDGVPSCRCTWVTYR